MKRRRCYCIFMGLFCIMLLSGILFTKDAIHHLKTGLFYNSNILFGAYAVYFVLMITAFILSFLLKPKKK
ncbi:hypothetical protein [Filifactor alocis]|uniref:hypothetical protein n=1 Tax=Filifactor alocis TaxID=143361 RepID=UPI0028D05C98|nr:hypothetical protein [Filifactor alocis]